MTRQFTHEWSHADQYILIGSKAKTKQQDTLLWLLTWPEKGWLPQSIPPLLSCSMRSMRNNWTAGMS